MRKEGSVTIEGSVYKVYELRVKDIWELGQQLTSMPKTKEIKLELEEGKKYTEEELKKKKEEAEAKQKSEKGKAFMDLLQSWLPRMTTLEWKNLYDFAPSEIEGLWYKFLEVNNSFLLILKKVGLNTVWESILQTFQKDMKASYQGLLSQDIEMS